MSEATAVEVPAGIPAGAVPAGTAGPAASANPAGIPAGAVPVGSEEGADPTDVTNLMKALQAERKLNKQLMKQISGNGEGKATASAPASDSLNPDLADLQKRVSKYENELQSYKVKDAKASALNKALSSMGEGFVIPDPAKLQAQVAKLGYDKDSIEADIQELVDLVKREPVKQSSAFPIIGQPAKASASATSAKAWAEMSGNERTELYRNDPAEYNRLRQSGSIKLGRK